MLQEVEAPTKDVHGGHGECWETFTGKNLNSFEPSIPSIRCLTKPWVEKRFIASDRLTQAARELFTARGQISTPSKTYPGTFSLNVS